MGAQPTGEPTYDPRFVPKTSRVILVRHARSKVAPARPAETWGLSEQGDVDAHKLPALALFTHATGFYAGPEPKMAATLAPLAAERGLPVQVDPAFAESQAGGWLAEPQFLAAVGRFLAAPGDSAAPGWEPAAAAVARFRAAIDRLREQYGPVLHPGHANPGAFAVASGGRVLTAYLAALLGYAAEDAFALWRRLRMPDIAVVEFAPEPPPRLVIPFGALATEEG